MDGDMVAIIVSAFGGGLAGAVLQPALTHFLARANRQEEITLERMRRLRGMVEQNLTHGRRLMHASMLRFAAEQRGQAMPISEMYDASKIVDGNYYWQPERIPDEELRRLALQHNQLCTDLFLRLYKADVPEIERADLRQRIDELAPKLGERMDALNWPVHD